MTGVFRTRAPQFLYDVRRLVPSKTASGTLRDLACDVAGLGTLAPRLNETVSLRVAPAGVGLLSPKLVKSTPLATGIAGTGAISPRLNETAILRSAVAGLGAVAARLNETAKLALASAGIGTVSPAISVQSGAGAPTPERTKTGAGT